MVTQVCTNPEPVSQAQMGNAESLALLMEQVRPRVYAYVRRVTLREDVAADVTQDTLMSIVNSLGDLQRTERFWPWVFRIASNKIRQHYRQEARHKASAMPDRIALASATDKRSDDALAELVRSEMAGRTHLALAGIPDRYRTALTLRYFQNLSYSDIAEAMDCSQLAARAIIFRAKSAFARQMKRDLVRQ